jgi:hypothetical protein
MDSIFMGIYLSYNILSYEPKRGDLVDPKRKLENEEILVIQLLRSWRIRHTLEGLDGIGRFRF